MSSVSRLAILIAVALAVVGKPAAAYAPWWIHGTGTATAHDKQLAHELAFNQAKRRAEAWCSGVYSGPSEVNASYSRIEATDEWQATVTIREMCQGVPVQPSDTQDGD